MRHARRPSRERLVPCLVAVLAVCAAATALAAEPEAGGLRRWGFGWDPGMSSTGLTVRYRLTPDWDLAVAAGPNDTRQDTDTAREVWDDGTEVDTDQATAAREESGWVRLSAGHRFWRQDRVSVSGVCSVYYTWSARENRNREFITTASPFPDYENRRYHYDTDTWTLGLGIRPSVVVMPRLQVEFDAGLALTSGVEKNEFERWWDSLPGYEHTQGTVHNRSFRTYGGFATTSLKFIFWF